MASDLRLRVILDLADKALGPIKRIGEGSKGLADKLREARGELRNLQTQQTAIAKYRALGNEFKASAATAQALRTRLAELRAATPANAAEAKKLASEIGATERQLKRASAAVDDKQRKLMGLRERLKNVGVKNLAQDEAQLSGRIAEANRQIDQQRGKLERLAKLRQQHGRQMMHVGMAAGAGMAMQAAGRKGMDMALGPVQQFMAHEDAMLGIQRQVPGARDEMGRLTEVYRQAEQQVRALSTEIPLSTTAIADMMTAAARMEVPTDQLAAQVKLAAEMAIAFDAVPDEIAESMGQVAKNYKIPITEIRGLADAINYLDDNAISKGADIIDYLKRTSGVVELAKMTAAQNAALGSTLLTAGAAPEAAATAMNAIFSRLGAGEKGAKRTRAAIEELGLSAGGMAKAVTTDALGALGTVLDKLGALPEEKRLGIMTHLVGQEHLKTITQLLSKRDELQRQLGLATGKEAEGSMAREASARYAALSAQWQMAKNRAFNLAATLGESLKPSLVDTMTWAARWAERATAWVQANPALAAGILKVALALSAITLAAGAVLVPLALIAGKVLLVRFMLTQMVLSGTGLMKLLPIVKAVGVGMWSLATGGVLNLLGMLKSLGTVMMLVGRASIGFLLSPMGLVLVAVVALAAGAYLLWKNWDTVKAKLSAVWQQITASASALWQSVVTMKDRFVQAGAELINGIIAGVTGKLAALKSTIVDAARSAASWFKDKLGIQSPSRVFMALGQHIPEGAALGIRRGSPALQAAALAMAALPALASAPLPGVPTSVQAAPPTLVGPAALLASRQAPAIATPAKLPVPAIMPLQPILAAPAAAAAPTMAGPSMTAPTTIHITINTAPGQDPQAIARAVSAELTRRERSLRSRVYSQLADKD